MKVDKTNKSICSRTFLLISLVSLLIPGLSVDSVAGHLPAVGHILTDLLRVAVPLTPLTVGLRREAHRALLPEDRRRGDFRRLSPSDSMLNINTGGAGGGVVHTCGICTCWMGLTMSVVSLPQ